MKQMTFNDCETVLSDKIRHIVDTVCSEQQIRKDYISIVENKENDVSLWIKDPIKFKLSYMVFNISKTKTRYDVTIKKKEADNVHITEGGELKIYKDKNGFISKYTVQFSQECDSMYAYLHDVFDYDLRSYETSPDNSYGCCHMYKECSDSKKCLKEDKMSAKVCQYRKNLEQGRIFYGKNRNID